MSLESLPFWAVLLWGPKLIVPFKLQIGCIEELNQKTDFLICEIILQKHIKKESIGWYLDGRVKSRFGTHTHVPTADGRILDKGTAYQTDLGMTGPRQSVLGREIKPCVDRFLHGMPQKCPVAEGDVGLQGCIVEIADTSTGKITDFQRIELQESQLAED